MRDVGGCYHQTSSSVTLSEKTPLSSDIQDNYFFTMSTFTVTKLNEARRADNINKKKDKKASRDEQNPLNTVKIPYQSVCITPEGSLTYVETDSVQCLSPFWPIIGNTIERIEIPMKIYNEEYIITLMCDEDGRAKKLAKNTHLSKMFGVELLGTVGVGLSRRPRTGKEERHRYAYMCEKGKYVDNMTLKEMKQTFYSSLFVPVPIDLHDQKLMYHMKQAGMSWATRKEITNKAYVMFMEGKISRDEAKAIFAKYG